jgi:hypothetical protein
LLIQVATKPSSESSRPDLIAGCRISLTQTRQVGPGHRTCLLSGAKRILIATMVRTSIGPSCTRTMLEPVQPSSARRLQSGNPVKSAKRFGPAVAAGAFRTPGERRNAPAPFAKARATLAARDVLQACRKIRENTGQYGVSL